MPNPTLSPLVTFSVANGSSPASALVADSQGNLFGTTNRGGDYGNGTVFEIKNIGTVAAPIYATTPPPWCRSTSCTVHNRKAA